MQKNTVSITRVLSALERLYRPPKSFLDHRSPFQLLIATLLSAQCTDVRVNIITERLFKNYRMPEDFARAPIAALRNELRTCSYYNAKARYIRATCRMLLSRFGGKVPSTMEDLTLLPGVGRKTAAIVLHVAFGKREGIAVDTHVFRVARRLGLSTGRTPQRVERDLMIQVPRVAWGEINPLLISHGRAVCTARNRKCEACVFRMECPSSRVMGRKDMAKD